MSLILLGLGILVTGASVVTIGFGIPNQESVVGQTLIIAGATGSAGGLVLVGLAAALAQLTVIAEAVKNKPSVATGRRAAEARRTAEVPEPRAPELPRAAEPAPAGAFDVSALAIERLRSAMPRLDRVVTGGEDVPLSPNGGHLPAEPALQPKFEPARPGTAAEALKEPPRLDFLFRARPPRPPQPESFDAMWPKRGARPAPEQPKADEVARQPAPAAPPGPASTPAEERRLQPASPAEPRSVAILKSGVVDGMAYTLYADGSIEAQLPHGTVRFGSIAELRAHIENQS